MNTCASEDSRFYGLDRSWEIIAPVTSTTDFCRAVPSRSSFDAPPGQQPVFAMAGGTICERLASSSTFVLRTCQCLSQSVPGLKVDIEQLRNLKINLLVSGSGNNNAVQSQLSGWLKSILTLEDKIRFIQSKTYIGLHDKDFRFLIPDLDSFLNVLLDLKQGTGDLVSSLDNTNAGEASDEDEIMKRKKEVHQQIEHDAIMRKNHNIHVTGSNVPSPLQTFEDLKTRYKCKHYLLRNFVELGYKEPTPIQRQAIPVLLSGRDCFACAPTGSGKSLAFICPMLMKLKSGLKDGVRAVILCPTRELAAQTTRECKKLAKGKKFYIKLMTKGISRSADFSKMPCGILISTPLRLAFAIHERKLDLSRSVYIYV